MPWICGVVWNNAWETTPGDAGLLSDLDTNFFDFKGEVRKRLDAEHDFSTFSPDTNDTGRQLEGSARAFMTTAAPANLGHNDFQGSPALDNGRLWVDSDGGGASSIDDNQLFVQDGAAPAKWEGVNATGTIPLGMIMLWDRTDPGGGTLNGDENCDGVTAVGECPCGFLRAPEFDNLTIRGADVDAASADIPNIVGVDCDETYGGGEDGECGAPAAGAYNEILEINELADHTHILEKLNTFSNGLDPAGWDSTAGADDATGIVDNATINTEHYHPFRTVLFCRKAA